MHDFGGAAGSPPCCYLGLLLNFRKPRGVEVNSKHGKGSFFIDLEDWF